MGYRKSDRIKKRKKRRLSGPDFSRKRSRRETIPRKRPKGHPKKKRTRKRPDLAGFLRSGRILNGFRWIFQIGACLLLAFVFVWYFGQRVSTVGDSMNPLLSNGDVVLVNRFVYNTSAPKRGDIIVFKPRGNANSHYYIKRIVGLPGEKIQIIEGSVYIDGEKLEEKYQTTEITDVGVVDGEMTLGGDEYFVLGDDRGKSEDSRMADVGNVKRSYIYGRAWFVVSPFAHFGPIKK